MEEDKKDNSEDGDSVWKSLVEEVKEEEKDKVSIESTPTKQGVETQESIENKAIEKPIEKSTEKPSKPPAADTKERKAGKFTTIMVTRELKKAMDAKKDPHESYGDFIKRIIDLMS